jgi:hypothetical protein
MESDKEFDSVVQSYMRQGYNVEVHPQGESLPAFAKDFGVDLVARRGDESVLISVKKNRAAVANDPEVRRYAELTEKQPGWRFDLAILEGQERDEFQGARELAAQDMLALLTHAERLVGLGFVKEAIITAWSALESSMRLKLRADGERAGYGTPPRQMINELYSSGALSEEEFRRVQALFGLRNEIVHGFKPSAAEPSIVPFVADLTRRLVDESQPVA